MARAAAAAADVAEDRVAVLRAASSVLSREPGVDDLKAEVATELDVERAAEAAYKAMGADVLAKADAAVRKADIESLQNLRASLAERDRALGGRRPAQMAIIAAALEAKFEVARMHRLSLEHYTMVRRSLLDYERQARPVMSGIDGLTPVLTYVRDGKFTAYERLVRAGARVETLAADLAAIAPPPDLTDVHATLVSALHMAAEAVSRRRMAATTLSAEIDQQASTAAAGALLLTGHAREQLVVRLFPPRIQ
jgi:predicted HAD superfamily Cof-like phosphohydrolase